MLPVMELIMPNAPSAGGTANVPAFLAKLWKMVEDPNTNNLISWSAEGTSFLIHNQAEFASSLLPYYYKHNNMASFIRQLNMYGFHKVVGVDSGGLKSEKQEEMEFAHQFFIKGMEELLEQIKRKVSSNKGGGASGSAQFAPAMKTEKVNEVLSEVGLIKDKQEDLDSKLETMKKENEALWKEVVNLRHKHQSQQKIVNKLIQFLVGIVQPRLTPGVKRRQTAQLAIEDVLGAKEPKLDGNVGYDTSSGVETGNQGPTISELPPETSSTTPLSSSDLMHSQVLYIEHPDGTTAPISIQMPSTPDKNPSSLSYPNTSVSQSASSQSPGAAAMKAVDPTLVNPALNVTAAKSPNALVSTRPVLRREISKEDFDMDVTSLQNDLDNLKDILSGQVTLDSNFVTSLFTPDDPIPNLVYPTTTAPGTMPAPANTKRQLQMDNNGKESKGASGDTPSLFELAEIDGDDNDATSTSKASELDLNLDTPLVNSGGNDDLSLETPLVQADNENPLTRQLRKKK